jgi:hypothetical protein
MTSTQPKPPAEPLLLGTGEVAAKLGWSKDKVRDHVEDLGGKLIAGRLQFRPQDIAAWVEAQWEGARD